MIAVRASPTAARWRRIASVIVPGVAPVGYSGTVRCPHAKLLVSPHGANSICAFADAAGAQIHAQAVNSTAASLRAEGCIHRNLLPGAAYCDGRALHAR